MSLLKLFHRHEWVYSNPSRYGEGDYRLSIRQCSNPNCRRREYLDNYTRYDDNWLLVPDHFDYQKGQVYQEEVK